MTHSTRIGPTGLQVPQKRHLHPRKWHLDYVSNAFHKVSSRRVSMSPCISTGFKSTRALARNGARLLAVLAALLVLAGPCFAATPTPTAASLNGVYVFHIYTVKEAYWYKSKNCTYSTGTFTYAGGGQRAYGEIITGEATFNGKGGVTFNATQMNKFNSTASDNTVIIP